jgi:geranylgeranyl pyrophosphate synthase
MNSPDVTTMDITAINALVEGDMKSVDSLILRRLHSDVALINQLSHYIINSGGKRLRPLIVLLTARACDYRGEQHINLAAVIEFIHTATLLHDDVVDASSLRRGNMTANAVWGNEAAVLVGDFQFSVVLTVPGTLHVVLATAELDDLHLVAAAMALDRRGNPAALEIGGTDPDVLALADHQHLIKLD